MTLNGNGNGVVYRVAMGIVGLIIVMVLSFMGTGIVNNDKLRASEDQRIEDKCAANIEVGVEKCRVRADKIVDKVEDMEQNMNSSFRQLFVEVGKLQITNRDQE